MLVDSWYDPYLGVVILVRVIDGVIKKGLQVKFMAGGTEHLIDRVGCMRPKIEQLAELGPGEIGFITAQIKEVAQARVGDTITTVKGGASEALPGFKEVQPVVFCGLFPVDAPTLKSCAIRSASCASTTPRSVSKWKPARRWASASAAASSACSIWRSSRSA
jgi:translation elongation factor EF-4